MTPSPESTKPKRRQSVEGCHYCDELRAEGRRYHPPHDASEQCESGSDNHCTCERCF